MCGYRVSSLINWCFQRSQPLRITSGLKETFIKRYIVERTNQAEIRPEEQSQITELVSWCFNPSQPLGITSGLKETFIKRYIVERTNKAKIRPEELVS